MYFCSLFKPMNFKTLIFLTFILSLFSCGSSVTMLDQNAFTVVSSADLPDELNEISSLQFRDGLFYGINDSGGEPVVYYFENKEPIRITRRLRISNATNKDWETTAESDSLLYIGDTGNNRGKRDDLKIYYIPKKYLNPTKISETVKADTIGFLYPEQEVYEDQAYDHDFDLEGMLWYNRKLHLFTKTWKSNNTAHYTLDIVKGKQPAWLVEKYDTGFMVTGADIYKISENRARLGLVGYTRNGDVFLLLSDINPNNEEWLNKPKKQILLGKAENLGQVEGIAFTSENDLCYSAEALKTDDGQRNQNLTCIRLK